MGNILNLNCKKCNYNEEFLLGAGFVDFELEKAIARFDPSTISQIDGLLKSDRTQRYNLDIVLGFCQKCNNFEAVPTITFYLAGKNPEKFISKCLSGNTPEIVDYIEGELLCPLCGSILEKGSGGCWD